MSAISGARKTTVLDRAAQAAWAEGWRVVRARGQFGDREIPYAAPLDVLDAAVSTPDARCSTVGPRSS